MYVYTVGEDSKLTKKCVLWTSKEEAWLAQCWIDSSEDSRKGNSQKREALWGTIYNKFNDNPHGWTRGDDQLSSKWRNLNKTCSDFNAAYNEARRGWKSGESDADVMEKAHATYRMNVGKAFVSMDAWHVLKDKPKWYVPGSGSSQAGNDEEVEGFSIAQDDIFADDRFDRPEGRDTSKKKQRSSYSSGSRSSRSSKAEEALEAISKHKSIKNQAISDLKRHEELRTAFAGASLLAVNTDSINNPVNKDYVENLQKMFRDSFKHLIDKPQENEPEEINSDSD